MDELTLLRELEADVPPVTEAEMGAGRERLAVAMGIAEHTGAHVPARRRMRSQRRRWALLAVGCAALLTVGLVLTDVVGFAGMSGGASAQAAELLHRAAGNAIRTSDLVVRPGQYLLVRTDHLNLTTTGGPAGDVSYAVEGTNWLFIPADEHGVWTEARSAEHSVAYYGHGAEGIAKHQDPQMAAAGTQVVRGRDGSQWGAAPEWTPSSLRDLPRDPRMLLNHIYRVTFGHGQSRDGEALVWIADLLRTGFVPADLRAGLYGAAAMIPGVTVTDSAATLDGRSGVAIGGVEQTTGIRQDVVVDPSSGIVIGERQVTTRPIDGLPAGTPISWTSVTTRVVPSVSPSTWSR